MNAGIVDVREMAKCSLGALALLSHVSLIVGLGASHFRCSLFMKGAYGLSLCAGLAVLPFAALLALTTWLEFIGDNNHKMPVVTVTLIFLLQGTQVVGAFLLRSAAKQQMRAQQLDSLQQPLSKIH